MARVGTGVLVPSTAVRTEMSNSKLKCVAFFLEFWSRSCGHYEAEEDTLFSSSLEEFDILRLKKMSSILFYNIVEVVKIHAFVQKKKIKIIIHQTHYSSDQAVMESG